MAAKRAAPEKKKAKESAPDSTAAATPAAANYVVFARRFRPRSFSDVVGQAAATGALRQALSSGRIAQAYLFCGPRGVGKTSLARIVAKALNCLNGKGVGGVAEEPCNECDACTAIHEGRSLDVIEMDAATNRGIEEVRSLRENVSIAPAQLRYKVYIIDEVHMLTREAWNAFLKTLEEPPPHVKFIFATTDPNNVPETILSRCQRFDLRRIGPADIVMRLKQICVMEKITCDEAALSRIASLARGGLRDAEGLLDQAVNLSQGNVTDAIVRELSGAAPDEVVSEMLMGCAAGKTADVLAKAHQTLEAGADPEDLLTALSERLRGALLCQVCGENTPLLEGQAHLKTAYAELSKALSADQIMMLVQLFTAARRQMRDAAQTRLPLEMALIRACRASDLVELGKLVGALESSGGGAAMRPQPAAHPPNREGFRPNSPGRPAGTVESRPAASEKPQSGEQKPATAIPVQAPAAKQQLGVSGLDADVWAKVVGAVAREKGGGLLVSALSHAQAARFDSAASALTLGFAASQLFYRDQLEKPQNQTMLLAALKGVLARDVTLVLERVTGAAVAPRPAIQATRPQAAIPAAASRAADEAEIDESSAEETEVEFDGVGELPLPAAPVAEAARSVAKAEDVDGEDAPPGAPVVAMPKVRPPVLDPRDRQAFEAHPLVQTVLRGVGGRVVNVIRK